MEEKDKYIDSINYRFEEDKMAEIVRDFLIMKDPSFHDIAFDFGYDDEDNQARLDINYSDLPFGLLSLLEQKIPNYDECYDLIVDILSEYMHAYVYFIEAFENYARRPISLDFLIKVDPINYIGHKIEHVTIHEWGF